jgi:aminoglycoside phosphotransferase (APT) family kinase protein
MTGGRDALGEPLAAACRRRWGAGEVAGLTRLSGGASQETWSFDFEGGERRELILRRNTRKQIANLSSETEFALVAAAAAGGVPVPRPEFLLDAADDMGSGYVMERIEGETIPRKILRDERFAAARPRMAAQAGRILARLHAVGAAGIAGLPDTGPDPAATALAQQRELIDRFGEPHPVFELALRWLAASKPPPGEVRLVHGDFRNGNLMVGPDGIRAVLDWELAHLGDPVEDLGWLCVPSWRFGALERAVGGFGDVDDLLAAYAEAGGSGAEPDRVHYWMVLGTLRWGVICQAQAFTHRSGLARSVELAAIGRRVCETEWDLLRLLDRSL